MYDDRERKRAIINEELKVIGAESEKRDGAKDPNKCQPQMCYKLFNYGLCTHEYLWSAGIAYIC